MSMGFKDKQAAFTSENRQKDIKEHAEWLWEHYGSLHDDQVKRDMLDHYFKVFEVEKRDIPLQDVSYETMRSIAQEFNQNAYNDWVIKEERILSKLKSNEKYLNYTADASVKNAMEQRAEALWTSYQAMPEEAQKHYLQQFIGDDEEISPDQVTYDTWLTITERMIDEENAEKIDALATEIMIEDDLERKKREEGGKQETQSSSATSSCEVCNDKNIRCLCNVNFTLPATNNEPKYEYDWKAYHHQNGMAVRNIILVSTAENRGNHTLEFTVSGTCKEGISECSQLYYRMLNPNGGDAEIKKGGQTGELSLLFDINEYVTKSTSDKEVDQALAKRPETLDDRVEQEMLRVDHVEQHRTHDLNSVFDAYASVKKDRQEGLVYAVNISAKNGKVQSHEARDVAMYPLGRRRIQDVIVSVPSIVSRTLNFAVFSKITDLPVSIYEVLVLECTDHYAIDTKGITEGEFFTLYPNTRLLTQCYVLPEYSVNYEIEFNFNGGPNIPKENKADLVHKYNNALGFKVNGRITESFGGSKEIIVEGEFDVVESLKALEPLANDVQFFKWLSKIFELTKTIEPFSQKCKGIMPDVGFYYPVLKFSGTSKLVYQDPFNINYQPLKIERENNRISADPLIGISITFNIINLLAALIGPLAPMLQDVDAKFLHWKVVADLKASLLLSGALNINSSTAGDKSHIELDHLEGAGQLTLDAKIEVGFRAVVLYATFTASFKLVGELNLGIVRTESGELGWYFGTTGVACYWRIVFVFGVGGDQADKKEDFEELEKSYGSIAVNSGGVGTANEPKVDELPHPTIWTTEMVEKAISEREKKLEGDDVKNSWRAESVLKARIKEYTKNVADAMRGDEILFYAGIVKENEEKLKAVKEIQHLKKIQKSIDEIGDRSNELIALTDKYKRDGYLSSYDNSKRLKLIDEITKIRTKYEAPYHPQEILDAEIEQQLRQERIDELDQLLNTTYSKKALYDAKNLGHKANPSDPIGHGARFEHARKKYIKERESLAPEGDDFGQAILCNAHLILSSDNLSQNDIFDIEQRLQAKHS